jgi:hypothetical protein
MKDSGYKLVCVVGETKGDEVILSKEKMPTAIRFLRAASEWSLASASDAFLGYRPEKPVFVEYFAATRKMIDEGIFKSKWQARSDWLMVEKEIEVFK